MGSAEEMRDVLAEIAKTTGDIFQFVVAIMCGAVFFALAIIVIVDQTNFISNKDKQIAELLEKIKELERSKTNGFKKNEATSAITDRIFDMYLDEKERADTFERNFRSWDKNRAVHIRELEEQLRSNNIEPITWEDIKFGKWKEA